MGDSVFSAEKGRRRGTEFRWVNAILGSFRCTCVVVVLAIRFFRNMYSAIYRNSSAESTAV